MPTLVIVGAQWGDEAKGKLVDVLGEQADMVVRYSGGNNAGHTVIVGGEEFKFHLVPAGILHEHVVSVLGSGMVICPKGLLEELAATKAKREKLGSLYISDAAHVVFSYHRMLDRLEETARGNNPIGTTSRGIGPAYQDKVARFGIRMGELVQPDVLRHRLYEVVSYKNKMLKCLGEPLIEVEELYEEYVEYGKQLKPYVTVTEPLVQKAVQEGKNVMFEGAQGALLDLDSGTYPYVTSSHPVAGGATLGTGIGPRHINNVLGVCKAYTTRVGSGPFPTELLDATGDRIREIGREYGTTTGRGRRCGWLDAVVLKHSAWLNSLSGWVLTRLDILSGFETIKVCTHYEIDGENVDYVPTQVDQLAKAVPVYQEFPGWDEDISGVKSLEELPANALSYLRAIEELTGIPVAVLSIGPDRDQTVIVRQDLIWEKVR